MFLLVAFDFEHFKLDKAKVSSWMSEREEEEEIKEINKPASLPSELTKLRQLWIDDKVTKKQMEKYINDLYPEGTYKGEKIRDIVKKVAKEHKESGRARYDFVMVYDLFRNDLFLERESPTYANEAKKIKNLVLLYPVH